MNPPARPRPETPPTPAARPPWSSAWQIAAIYGVFATLWIYFSDHALGLLIADPAILVRWSVFKGLGFVLITSALLLWLMSRALGSLKASDITRAAHERELERLSRLYAALSQINQAIVWTPAREALFAKICQVLVEHGEFRLAWIGWHDPASDELRPVAQWGDEVDYVRDLRISVSADRPEGRGPSGTAFRENRPYICNQLLDDASTQPWREKALRRGLRASAVFPIHERDRVVGVLNVYAAEAGFFQQREIALLTEAAGDISFALANLSREAERHTAEAAARNEKLFSDTMIDTMPGILYFYDESGRFLRWNTNFERISGYSAAEIAQMAPPDFFAASERPHLTARIAEVFAQGESSLEAAFLSKDGTTTPYFFTGRRVVFDNRVCLVGVGIDLTARKRAEAALREVQARLEVVVENLGEGLIIAEPQGAFLHWNPAALRLLGFADPAEGRRRQADFAALFELTGLDGVAVPPEQWPLARVRRGERLDGLEVCVRRRGTDWSRIFSYTGARVRYAEDRDLAFMTLNDITARKQAEQQLREARDGLELKVAERTAELQTALVRAEAADRLKSAFLATMSHELRTPLNSIIGFTGLVLQGLAGPLNAEQTKQLGMVRGSARHLLELINDVLDISKIEAGQLEVRADPFDLGESIERVTASVRPLAEKKALQLSVVAPLGLGIVVGDRRRVEQVLLNLLHNAIKFTERGRVTLTVTTLDTYRPAPGTAPRPAVQLRVSDTGIGLRPEDLTSLFQPFRQIDSGLARQHEGTGLGLAICRRLATLMGGEITASSEWSKGSEFTVVLPREKTTAP